MIFAQIITTCFISLQWIISFSYQVATMNEERTMEQNSIIMFVISLTATCYHLNNAKAFYISMLTSKLFRRTFIKGLNGLLPRSVRARLQVTQTNTQQHTGSKLQRQNLSKVPTLN